jgi:hypothetical protein
MKTILVIAEPVKIKDGNRELADREKWQNFLSNIQQNVKSIAAIRRIHENVWQIPADTGLPFLTDLFRWKPAGASFRILFLDEAPQWLEYP